MATESTYEEEQAELQRKYEGDLHIDVPQEIPEVNPEVFKDVEPLVFRGFLHTAADINGVPFIFKSLNHHEFEMLRLMVPEENTRKLVQQFSSCFLAYGVFMVAGTSVLNDRERWIPELTSMFENMNSGASSKVVRHLSEINRRASRAVILTEAYTMEMASRLRWAQLRGVDLTASAVTGITGTTHLGMNWAQLTWRAMNYYEDQREQAEREWENSKFVASAMAGKGMSRVHNQDRRRREQERTLRLERRDKILRFALLGEPMDTPTSKSAPLQVARTVGELATQLENDLKGEKDWHDLVVESYEKRAQQDREVRAQQLQQMQRNYDVEYGPRQLVGVSDLKGLTREEVQFQITRRQQLAAQRLSAQEVHPEMVDPKVSEFVNKWSSISKTNMDPSQVPPLPTSSREAGGVPFRTRK